VKCVLSEATSRILSGSVLIRAGLHVKDMSIFQNSLSLLSESGSWFSER